MSEPKESIIRQTRVPLVQHENDGPGKHLVIMFDQTADIMTFTAGTSSYDSKFGIHADDVEEFQRLIALMIGERKIADATRPA